MSWDAYQSNSQLVHCQAGWAIKMRQIESAIYNLNFQVNLKMFLNVYLIIKYIKQENTKLKTRLELEIK